MKSKTTKGPHARHGQSPKAQDNVKDPIALCFHAASGILLAGGAPKVTRTTATKAAHIPDFAIDSVTQIPNFTHEYGFLNKQLSVWRIEAHRKTKLEAKKRQRLDHNQILRFIGVLCALHALTKPMRGQSCRTHICTSSA